MNNNTKTDGNFMVRNLDAGMKEFLRLYAKQTLGKGSINAAFLHIIREKMHKCVQLTGREEPPAPKKPKCKERLSLSLYREDFDALTELADASGCSTNYYLRVLIRSHLGHKGDLLGNEIEVLKESNYQLSRLGANLNQVARMLNQQSSARFETDALRRHIDAHVTRVGGLLNRALNR